MPRTSSQSRRVRAATGVSYSHVTDADGRKKPRYEIGHVDWSIRPEEAVYADSPTAFEALGRRFRAASFRGADTRLHAEIPTA